MTLGTDTHALLSAVTWLQNVLLGPIATAVAIVAVGTLGYLALSGRIDLRRGASVIAGCFIVFGAPTIARGIQSAAGESSLGAVAPAFTPSIPVSAPVLVQKPMSTQYDPYAGASVEQR